MRAQRNGAAVSRLRDGIGQHAAVDHQRPAGHIQDRKQGYNGRKQGFLPARSYKRNHGGAAQVRSEQKDNSDSRDRPVDKSQTDRRRSKAEPDTCQSGRKRYKIYRQGFRNRKGGAHRPHSGRPDRKIKRNGYRHRNSGGQNRPYLQYILSGRFISHQKVSGHRSGPGHSKKNARGDGLGNTYSERAAQGQRFFI
ncbi:MAG: hypothetical protein ACD_47C00173G0001 [uncultured bacterium]|nr:MAG: hypothetical protein ACD_47C00173G0001 [uncultured bacterium]